MTTAYLEDDEIQRIATAVADELENRGAAMAALDQRVKEQAERIEELESKLSAAEAWGRNEVQRANDTADHVIAERDQRIAVFESDLAHATAHDGDHLSKASRAMCDTVLGDRDALRAKVRELTALVEALRCGDLTAFHDGELTDDRRVAFQLHLATCGACASELLQLMQLEIGWAQDGGSAIADRRMETDWAPQACTAAIACPRADCRAARGERCKTDRPLHVERWDAWRAVGFPSST